MRNWLLTLLLCWYRSGRAQLTLRNFRNFSFCPDEKVKKELKYIEEHGVNTKTECSNQGSSLVILPKPNVDCRLRVEHTMTLNPLLLDCCMLLDIVFRELKMFFIKRFWFSMYTYVFMLIIGDWSTRILNQDKLDFDFSVGLTLEITVRLSYKIICQDYQEPNTSNSKALLSPQRDDQSSQYSLRTHSLPNLRWEYQWRISVTNADLQVSWIFAIKSHFYEYSKFYRPWDSF